MFFHCNSYIVQEQHGFMPKRSTCSNLIHYTSHIIRDIQQGLQVDAVYTDLSAAFDKINHEIAIAKFERLGFSSPFTDWLRSYLTGREMRVKIGDTISASFIAYSGVPQGSHLGPLTYLVYMNDVHFPLKCHKLSFADDIKMFAAIKSVSDAALLQHDINTFADLCSSNCMVLNTSKCSVITFSRKRSNIDFDYNLLGTTLRRVSSINDLGIIMDQKLTFVDHISYVTSKASKSLGFIFRIAKGFDQLDCLNALYCSLVRSSLEYCSVVWAPYYQVGILRIESVQRKYTRFSLRRTTQYDPTQPIDYEERCRILKLDMLTVRLDCAKAMFVCDLLQSKIDSPQLLQELNIDIRRRVLRNHSFLRIPNARTNYGLNEPVASMCRAFNSCCDLFDFHLSRDNLKSVFLQRLSAASNRS